MGDNDELYIKRHNHASSQDLERKISKIPKANILLLKYLILLISQMLIFSIFYDIMYTSITLILFVIISCTYWLGFIKIFIVATIIFILITSLLFIGNILNGIIQSKSVILYILTD